MATKNTLSDNTKDIRIFPGITKGVSSAALMPVLEATVMQTITGKGAILGGYIYSQVGVDQHQAGIIIRIDGGATYGDGWERMALYNVKPPANSLFRVTTYDTVNHIYALDIFQVGTFEKKVEFWYDENDNNAVVIGWKIMYTLFE